ncbi:hypothetical protein EVAR_29424_1 [Eumeta japonica]|uniref:Uncharacterized protein n=1 Tax=Eumeta variegata TaxID=151549 RepID=A0A4C1VV43_EUMVA|nr:hypothetical protein EVAR_29424_1 [Eumeta japonica]
MNGAFGRLRERSAALGQGRVAGATPFRAGSMGAALEKRLPYPKPSESESSGGPLAPLPLPSTLSFSIRRPIPIQDAGNALVTPLELRVSMGGSDYLPSDGLPARLPHDCAIEKMFIRP